MTRQMVRTFVRLVAMRTVVTDGPTRGTSRVLRTFGHAGDFGGSGVDKSGRGIDLCAEGRGARQGRSGRRRNRGPQLADGWSWWKWLRRASEKGLASDNHRPRPVNVWPLNRLSNDAWGRWVKVLSEPLIHSEARRIEGLGELWGQLSTCVFLQFAGLAICHIQKGVFTFASLRSTDRLFLLIVAFCSDHCCPIK